MSCLSDHSRSGVPIAPRKYLVVTMLAALTLHTVGYSTPRCSKLIEPSRQFVMTTSRRSHSTSSYGWTPSVVQTRSTRSPPAAAPAPFARLRCLPAVMPSPAILLPLVGPSATRRYYVYPLVGQLLILGGRPPDRVATACRTAASRAIVASRSAAISFSNSSSES